MLKHLRIKNFKGWQDTGIIQMAPLTLFFGTNSSGKSSIGQFLMMLKQTAELPDRQAVFYPGGKSSAVQLGSFPEMVHGRNPEHDIFFEYEWSLGKQLHFTDSHSARRFSADHLQFAAKVGLIDPDRRSTLVLKTFEYFLKLQGRDTLSIGMVRKPGHRPEYDVRSTSYNLLRNRGRAWSPGAPVRFYGFPDEVVAYYQNADFVQELNFKHEQLFASIAYLGPLRTRTERLYSWAGNQPENVGYSGENTVPAILAASDRKLSLGYKQKKKPFVEIIARSLMDLGLIEGFTVKPISEKRQEYEVKLRTRGSRDPVDLPDVGFGISQVLPVLVQSFYAPPRSILVIEQPEIHLHPSAQSDLADVLINVINSRENGFERNIQLIIETHSEHFLRRLQRRIAEKALPQEKVSAYFANVDQFPTKLEPLKIDPFGNVRNWPKHFFGDEMTDIAEQSKHALKEQIRQRNSASGNSQ